MRPRTSILPETLAQVRQWEKTKARYLRAGLCHKCAAQAAWAHQPGTGGFKLIHPPCDDCFEIVQLLPTPTSNPVWRQVFRKRL
jgi:hypothetical protein